MKKINKLVLGTSILAALTLGLAGCSTTAETPKEPDTGSNDNTQSDVSSSIVGTSWKEADGNAFVEFIDGNKVTGNDGCNTFNGEYSISGNDIKMGEMATTMMFCEGVDTSWLNDTELLTVDGNNLNAVKGTEVLKEFTQTVTAANDSAGEGSSDSTS